MIIELNLFGGVQYVDSQNVEKNADRQFQRFDQILYKFTKRRRA